jgi:RHS repeat-associated protein
LSKTRVWGSNEEILLHFRATLLLSEKQHWGYEKCSWKNVVGSGVTYDYDAFGNLIHSTGTTPNNYLFASEQFDSDLHLYYNRARYLSTSTGRFWSMDTDEGDFASPPSLHKYLYAGNDPIDLSDPSGRDFGFADAAITGAIANTINSINANVGTSVIQGLQCAQQDTCKNATTGALFALAFNALAATFIIGGVAVVGKILKQLPLRFSQITASSSFSAEGTLAGETIGSVAAKLRTGKISPVAVPVQYIVRGGVRLIVNTRSALALLRGAVPEAAWEFVEVTGNPEAEAALTNRLANNGLTNEGTEVLRITQPGIPTNASGLQ